VLPRDFSKNPKKFKKYLDKSFKLWFNIRCHCVKAYFWLKSNTLPDHSGHLESRDENKIKEVQESCSEPINPKSVREKKSTASEREWQLPMAEMS